MNVTIKIKNIINDLRWIPKAIGLVIQFDRKRLIISLILSLVIGVIPSISLLLSQQMINAISIRSEFRIVIKYLLIYVVVSLLSEYVTSYKNYNEAYLQNNVNYKLNYMVMQKCKNLSLEDFENSAIYDKLQRIQGEISYKPYQTLQLVFSVLTITSTLITSIIILITWKPWSALFLLVIPALSSFYYLKLGRAEFEYKLKRTEEGRKSWYLSKLLTMDTSIKEVKLFNLHRYLIDKYKEINLKFIQQDMKYMRRRSLYDIVHSTILHICSCIVVVLSVLSAYSGQILIGNVVTYIRSISSVENGCTSMLNSLYSLYSNSLYIRELFEFFGLEDSSEEFRESCKSLDSIRTITLKNLDFTYKSGKAALKNINLHMKAGQKIAIVGMNGSGKTTLIKLITCLYHKYKGEILINDINIKEFSPDDVRKQISVLFQDYVKYEMNLRSNVGFGNVEEQYNDKKINSVLEKTELKNTFTKGLDTQLGLWFNDGIGLSGGQWQKLAIARMMFKECSVYILDEPNAALDPISVNEILESFFEYAKDKLCIFITHKMSSVHYADRIIVMKNGEIVGDGTHESLYKDNEYYKNIYDKEMN